MATSVEFDLSQFDAFLQKLSKAAQGDFRREMGSYLEALGNEFLRVLEDEIIRREVMDTRLLLNSFHPGSSDGVWRMDEADLTLEVGTSISYASYVNDGHWTNPKGVATRWVPGYWNGDRFVYDSSSKTGMLLKQKWIPGKHYWDSALRIIEKMFPKLLDKKMQEWIDRYFGG